MKTLYKENGGILLFDNVEILDFAGLYEVFTVADELNGCSLFEVFTLSENGDDIKTIHGLKVHTDYSTGNAPVLLIMAA